MGLKPDFLNDAGLRNWLSPKSQDRPCNLGRQIGHLTSVFADRKFSNIFINIIHKLSTSPQTPLLMMIMIMCYKLR